MKVLLPNLRKNGTIRISTEDIPSIINFKKDKTFYLADFCIKSEDVTKLPSNTIIKDFDMRFISNPDVIFRGNINFMQYVTTVYTIKGVDCIINSKHLDIWNISYDTCPDVKKQLIDILNLKEDAFNDIKLIHNNTLSKIEQLADYTRNVTLLMGYTNKDSEAIKYILNSKNEIRFILNKDEASFNKRKLGPNLVLDEKQFKSINSNPLLLQLKDNSRSVFFKYLEDNYKIESNNKYLLYLLISNLDVYLASNLSLLNLYGIGNKNINYDILLKYSSMAHTIYDAVNYGYDTGDVNNLLKKEYGIEDNKLLNNFKVNIRHMRAIIDAKTKFSKILVNFKVTDYSL